MNDSPARKDGAGLQRQRPVVLVVDDEAIAVQAVSINLKAGGIRDVAGCSDPRLACRMVEELQPQVLLLDLVMPHVGGEEILKEVRTSQPDTQVIVCTGDDQIATAVRCMRQGAFDYIVKPVSRERLISSVQRALDQRNLVMENERLRNHLLRETLDRPEVFAGFDSSDPKMMALFRYAEAISTSPEPVLITGETGTGKEVMARAIHELSARGGAFVAVNVAGLDDTAFSDTLFGHRKGAFTNASEPRKGLVETAAGGTLFLDEIGDLATASQLKLLRLLQEREYLPMGEDLPRRSTCRFVVATNRDLSELSDPAKFRRDLYFRLRRHHLHIPPLRERAGDLAALIAKLSAAAAAKMNKPAPQVPQDLVALLSRHPFPGNVRELDAMVADAVASSAAGKLDLAAFRKWIGGMETPPAGSVPAAVSATGMFAAIEPLPTLRVAKEELVAEALRRCNGRQTAAAAMLGISRQALSQRLRQGADEAE